MWQTTHCTTRWMGSFSVLYWPRRLHSSSSARSAKCCQGWEQGSWKIMDLCPLPFTLAMTSSLPIKTPCLCSPVWRSLLDWQGLVYRHTGNFQFLIPDQWGIKLKHSQVGVPRKPCISSCQPNRLRNMEGKREWSKGDLEGGVPGARRNWQQATFTSKHLWSCWGGYHLGPCLPPHGHLGNWGDSHHERRWQKLVLWLECLYPSNS